MVPEKAFVFGQIVLFVKKNDGQIQNMGSNFC